MKRLFLAALAAVSLSGCAAQLNDLKDQITPTRCESVLKAATRIEDIANFLASQGVDPAVANEVANYVAQGHLTITEVCNAINGAQPPANSGPSPAPGPGSNVVSDVTN